MEPSADDGRLGGRDCGTAESQGTYDTIDERYGRIYRQVACDAKAAVVDVQGKRQCNRTSLEKAVDQEVGQA